jgi:hypothetical protein
MGSRGSSVSIASDYGLDDRAIGVRSAEGQRIFPLTSVSRGPPSLLHNGYRGSFPWGKARPGRDADHSSHVVPRSRMSRSYIASPPQAPPWCVAELLCFFFLPDFMSEVFLLHAAFTPWYITSCYSGIRLLRFRKTTGNPTEGTCSSNVLRVDVP